MSSVSVESGGLAADNAAADSCFMNNGGAGAMGQSLPELCDEGSDAVAGQLTTIIAVGAVDSGINMPLTLVRTIGTETGFCAACSPATVPVATVTAAGCCNNALSDAAAELL